MHIKLTLEQKIAIEKLREELIKKGYPLSNIRKAIQYLIEAAKRHRKTGHVY